MNRIVFLFLVVICASCHKKGDALDHTADLGGNTNWTLSGTKSSGYRTASGLGWLGSSGPFSTTIRISVIDNSTIVTSYNTSDTLFNIVADNKKHILLFASSKEADTIIYNYSLRHLHFKYHYEPGFYFEDLDLSN